MVPFVQTAPAPLPPPQPTIYSYAHHQPNHHHHHYHQQQPIYQKQIQYVPPATITPLQTQVDYGKNVPTIVPKHALPSVSTTSFRQYYSPGLEYHYTELVPATKLSQAPSYAYHHSPSQNYQTSYVSQPFYYPQHHQQPQPQHHHAQYSNQYKGLLDSYVPSYLTYARQNQQHNHHVPQFKNHYPSAPMQQHHQQHLFTPASASSSSSSHYVPYPSGREYNTIAYSVPLPPYDHSKRSTQKASVGPKTTASSPSSSSSKAPTSQ